MKTEETRSLVGAFMEAKEAYDFDRVYELLADDAEVHFPQSIPIKSISGRDNVARSLTSGHGTYVDVSTRRVEPVAIIADGDLCVVRQDVSCKTTTGKDYRNGYCWVFNCKDGKVTRLEEFADTLYAARIFEWVIDNPEAAAT